MSGGESSRVETCVVVEREEVVVDVAARKRGRGDCLGGQAVRLSASGEPLDGHEANGLHVTPAFQSIRLRVVSHVVADVGMPAEELNGCVPLLRADRPENRCILLRAQGHMTRHHKQIDVSVADRLLEPLFPDCLLDRLYHGVIIVAHEVE